MIDIKEAITKGKEILGEIYGQPDDLLFDSAKAHDNGWLVKFRVPLKIKPINSLQNVLGINKRIFYKTVRFDYDGEIIEIIDEDLSDNQAADIQPQTI